MSEKDALYAQLLALQDEYRTRADPIVKRLMHMLAAEPLKPIIVSLDEVPEGLRRLMDLGAMDDFRQITAAKSDETPDK